MINPRYNDLFKWGVENSDASRKDPNAPKNRDTKLDPQVLQEILLGGVAPKVAARSDAEIMVEAMTVITKAEYTLKQKTDAFESFEFLVQDIDNANNMENLKLWNNLKLWDNLITQLEHDEADIRMWAAWSAGTAVENNPRGQERLLVHGVLPTLVKLATQDEDFQVRKKAIRALSCASRNFQPGLDAVVDHVPTDFKPEAKLDAGDMSSVNSLMDRLRSNAEGVR